MPSEATQFRRGPGNPGWTPGRSGNPGGRASDKEIAQLARRYAVDIIRAWVDVCRNATENPSARVAAANALADRGWGKPRQEVEVSGSMGQALHLHLYAVQRLEEARQVAADLEAPPIDGEVSDYDDVLLPDPPPEEALPLWDAMRSPGPTVDHQGEPATEDTAMGQTQKPDHPHGTPPGQDPDFVPPGHGGTPPGQENQDKPPPQPAHPIAEPEPPTPQPQR